MSLIDLIPGGAQARGALIASAALLTFGAGVAATEAYEHWVPWGMGHRLTALRDSLPARDAERYSAGARAQKALDENVVETSWRPALAACQADRTRLSQGAASSITAEQDAAKRSSDAAYRLGRASCGASNGKISSTPTPGSTPTGGLPDDEDLRSIVAGSLGRAP